MADDTTGKLMGQITLAMLQQDFAASLRPPYPWDNVAPLGPGPEDVIPGYVEAWRWWKLGVHQLMFHPFSNNYDDHWWKWSGENVADIPPLLVENTTGLYAYKRESIEDHNNELFGRVALYGDVAEHKHGYRAEKARILDVWVDADTAVGDPGVYAELMKLPQVKGTFDTFDPSIVDVTGEKGDYQCLILESQKELSGSSLSDGPTTNPSLPQRTCLIIDNQQRSRKANPSLYESMCAAVLGASKTSSGTLKLHPLLDPNHEWIIRPDGKWCPDCSHMIGKDDPVVIEFQFPTSDGTPLTDLTAMVLNRTFEWRKMWRHLECAARGETVWRMAGDWATGGVASNAFRANTPVYFSFKDLTNITAGI